MSETVRRHYERYPYPQFPLLASVRAGDTYALNLIALWTRFNGELPPKEAQRILIAGCGSFSPYPFSVANPESEITALDLSASSLRRARLHCLLHGRHNVRYRAGDLLDAAAAPGPFDDAASALAEPEPAADWSDDDLRALDALASAPVPMLPTQAGSPTETWSPERAEPAYVDQTVDAEIG